MRPIDALDDEADQPGAVTVCVRMFSGFLPTHRVNEQIRARPVWGLLAHEWPMQADVGKVIRRPREYRPD